MGTEPKKRVDIISFMAPINDNTISRLIDLTYTAHMEGSSEIHLYLSSIGGKLPPAFCAYDFFRSMSVPFCTHNVGTIESAALLLYLASDNRSATPHSKFLFYNFEWTFYRDHIRSPEIGEAYEALTLDTNTYSKIFTERTNGTFDIMACMNGPAKVLGPEEAFRAGIVTETKNSEPIIPELAKLWSIHN
ncbi:MAG: ATP-dependent Clp protease proteolytic subunit [Planctomycetes bacterium]|nr:ATP-dependent Clp protease proteolytic subunit [Planctomycetota bacterium]